VAIDNQVGELEEAVEEEKGDEEVKVEGDMGAAVDWPPLFVFEVGVGVGAHSVASVTPKSSSRYRLNTP